MLVIRVVQFVFTVIVLGLTAHVSNLSYYTPSEVNFLLFTSIWTLLILIYLIVTELKFQQYAHKFVVLGVEFLTMLFWFSGFIALAVWLSDVGCSDTRASGAKVCQELNAATAFGAFNWFVARIAPDIRRLTWVCRVLFAITTAMATIHVLRSRGSSDTRPAPEMHATAHATA